MYLKDIYLGIKFSISYFSILPVKLSSDDDLGKRDVLLSMALFFPAVGLIVSTLSTLLIFDSENPYFCLLSAIFYMISYGFLHTEAIIDVVDAIFSKHSKKDSYTIIKEPTVGAMGVLWGVSFLILKLASIIYLFYIGKSLFLIVIAISSRLGALITFKLLDFKSTFLNSLKNAIYYKPLVITVLFYIFLIYLLGGFIGVSISILGLTLFNFFVKALNNMVGFINGDVIGATIEVIELILIMFINFFISFLGVLVEL